jgi:hypothetical protein
MISLQIRFHEEPKVITPSNNNYTAKKQTYTARQCYTLIKKYKKKGFQIGVPVGTKYSNIPLGIITGYVTPPKDGIIVWNDEPSLIQVENTNNHYKATYRANELILFKLNKTTGELENAN